MGGKIKKCMAVTGIFLVMVSMLTGCGFFDTVASLSNRQTTTFSSAEDLESGKAYVLHDNQYYTCITGEYNFRKKELDEVTEYPRSIWVESSMDAKIPTVMAGDMLLYVSEEEVPDSIVFERFADYGYTIGISNLKPDLGGHYYIVFADIEEDDYKYSINMQSDASVLTELGAISKLYLDKVGGNLVTEENVSDGGTILGLEKNQTYKCEFYTGTYYQDFNLKANIHSFGSLERFVSHDYAFMHSNAIAIQVPDYFVSGYYFVQGVGLFRYVSESDTEKYNGEAYDDSIDWNAPIILYHEDGTIKYDPSNPDSEVDYNENSDPGDNGDVEYKVSIGTNATENDSGGKETEDERTN